MCKISILVFLLPTFLSFGPQNIVSGQSVDKGDIMEPLGLINSKRKSQNLIGRSYEKRDVPVNALALGTPETCKDLIVRYNKELERLIILLSQKIPFPGRGKISSRKFVMKFTTVEFFLTKNYEFRIRYSPLSPKYEERNC